MRTREHSDVPASATVQFFLGLYGGYFGGAVGLMMLAAWSALGGGDIKSLNPTRMVMVTAANAVAVVVFVLAGVIVWQECIPMTIG
ncbi:TSUP family transporter, partial [Rhizobium ruizarguesonis]